MPFPSLRREDLKLPPLPSLASLKERLPALPSLAGVTLPASISIITLDDLRRLRLPESLPDAAALRAALSCEEARIAGLVAAGVTAAGALLFLVRRVDPGAPAVEIVTLDDLIQLNAGGLLRDLAARLVIPTVTAVRVTGHGDRIPALPRGVYNLVRLKELTLAGNGLRTLPPGIGRLAALEALDLSDNALTALPDDIGAAGALVSLNAMGNRLETLPASIGGLTSLVRLGLKDNRLRALPPSIGQLKRLKELFLTGNELAALPEELGSCTALVKLQASHNAPLAALPASLGALPHLELLRVACCGLTEIPAAVAAAPALAWTSFATNPVARGPSPRLNKVPAVRLSDLEVGRKLGDGASGEVFEAMWRGRRVALKLFRADRSPDGHSADEMAIACVLSERHLVKVLARLDRSQQAKGGGGEDEPLGLVLEFVEGAPLADKPNSASLLRCRWALDACFSLDFVLNCAAGVAGALEGMHARGLLHGDVYAHNVLADAQGSATLCDYGAAYYAPRGLAGALEGQEARGFGLLLRDLVGRLDIGFEGMEAALDAQKQLLLLVQQCCSGPPAGRPRMAAVARQLRALQRSAASRGTTPRSARSSARSTTSANGHAAAGAK